MQLKKILSIALISISILLGSSSTTFANNTQSSTKSYPTPKVSAKTLKDRIILKWNPILQDNLCGYKVVISKNNSKPQYPENGYLYWITDKNHSYAVIDNKDFYNNGDFGGKLVPGQKYYFSVTALYNDKKVRGNVLYLKYPGVVANKSSKQVKTTVSSYPAPKVSAIIDGEKINLKWTPIKNKNLMGYKVVISKNNPHPAYPNNGYLYWITDVNVGFAVIDNTTAYNGGDFGDYLVPDQKYYISVTAVYNDRKVAGNAIPFIYLGN